MKRRSFLSLFGLAAAPLPSPAKPLPPVVKVVKAVVNPHTPGTIEFFLCQEAERITRELRLKHAP